MRFTAYLSGYVATAYFTLTSMMHDPSKPYRGHYNIIDFDERNKQTKQNKTKF